MFAGYANNTQDKAHIYIYIRHICCVNIGIEREHIILTLVFRICDIFKLNI